MEPFKTDGILILLR